MNIFIQNKQSEFEKITEHYKREISLLRTGRATASILDSIRIEAYGSLSPLNSVASITVQDAHSIVVAPWDKNFLKVIEKSITDARLNVSVINEGDKIRINIPIMTEESRKQIVKQLNEKTEEGKIQLRHLRDEIKSKIESAEKNKEISQDEKFNFIEELDAKIHTSGEDLKELRNKKEIDIMAI